MGGQVDERAGNPPHHSALFYCTPLQVHSTTALHSTPYSNHFTANRQHPIPPHIHAPHICGQDHPPYKIYAKNGIVTIVRFKRAFPPYVLGPKVTIVELRTSHAISNNGWPRCKAGIAALWGHLGFLFEYCWSSWVIFGTLEISSGQLCVGGHLLTMLFKALFDYL